MADMDTSFYPKPAMTAQSGLTPLLQLGQFQQLMNQNQLFQAQFQARNAMGELLQQAIDKSTGDIDYSKATMLLASDPRTAFMAPEFAKEALLRKQTQAEILLKELQSGQIRVEQQSKAALALLDKGTAVTRKDVISTAARLYGDGFLSQPELLQMVQSVPEDGVKINALMKQLFIRGAAISDSLNFTKGELQQINAGGETVLLRVPHPLTGEAASPVARIESTPTPDQRNAVVEFFDPVTRMMRKGTRQDALPLYSGTGRLLNGPGGGSALQPGMPGTELQPAPGGLPPAGALPSSETLAPAGGAPRSIQAQPSTVRRSFDEKVGFNVAEFDDNLNKDIENTKNLLQRLTEMEKAGSQAELGAGTPFRKALAETVQAIGSFAPEKYRKDFQDMTDRLAKGDLSALQVFEKLSSQGAMEAVKAAMGSQNRIAVMEFETFLRTNPNLSTDPDAVSKIFNFMRTQAQGKIAQQQEWQTWKKLNAQNEGAFPLDGFQAYWMKKLIDEGKVRPELVTGTLAGSEGNSARPPTRVERGGGGTSAGPRNAPRKTLKELGLVD
jgi:hypothetical protein